MPLPVLEELKATIVDYQSGGLSLIETSHRSSAYDDIHNGAVSSIRELLSVPDNFSILFPFFIFSFYLITLII